MGVNNYMLFTKKEKLKKTYKKTIIIPAKNEEKNLEPLFERIPKLSGKVEYIFICGPSKDKTLEVSPKLKILIQILIFVYLIKKLKVRAMV